VLTEANNLRLDVVHVVRKGTDGVALLLTSLERGKGALLKSTLVPLVYNVHNEEDKEDGDKRSENSESLGALREEGGKTEEEEWKDTEDQDEVDDRESTPYTSSLSEADCKVKWDPAHEWDWVPDDNTRDVEEQVAKCYLKGVGTVRDEGGQESSDGSSDVGSEGKWEHLLKTEGSHTNEWSKGRSRDGRTLYKDGDSSSYEDGQVSVDVGCLVDDTCGHGHQHLLEASNETDQTDDKDTKSQYEANSS